MQPDKYPSSYVTDDEARLIVGNKSSVSVVKGNCGSLLSCTDCVSLDLVSLNEGNLVCNISSSPNKPPLTDAEIREREILFAQYPEVFSDKIGKLKDFQAKLNINPNVAPVRQKHRHVPHHLKEFVTQKIQKMIEDDVLEPATGPMPWISPLLALPKPGHDGKAITEASQLRIVADITVSNNAIMRGHRVTMSPEELAVEVGDSDLYSAIDLIESYSQVELAEES